MKIAISVPDEVFRGVERAAKRLGITRSELLSRAAVAFLAEHRAAEVTASYDRAFGPASEEGEADDASFRREAARRSLGKVAW